MNWFPSAVVTGPQKADIKRTSGGNYRQEGPIGSPVRTTNRQTDLNGQDETVEAFDLTFLLIALNLNYPS